MRGRFFDQGGMFSYIRPEQRIPADHPLRKVRELVREVLGELNQTFGKLYSREGRPSIPPEQLLSALLLQVFYSIRSERQLMEQLNYNLLFRWFVGLSPDDPIWDPTVFTKNRERLQQGDVFQITARRARTTRIKARLISQTLSQGRWARGQALLHGPCAHGEQERPCRRRHGHTGERHGRTVRFGSHAQEESQRLKAPHRR
jgi:transposase